VAGFRADGDVRVDVLGKVGAAGGRPAGGWRTAVAEVAEALGRRPERVMRWLGQVDVGELKEGGTDGNRCGRVLGRTGRR